MIQKIALIVSLHPSIYLPASEFSCSLVLLPFTAPGLKQNNRCLINLFVFEVINILPCLDGLSWAWMRPNLSQETPDAFPCAVVAADYNMELCGKFDSWSVEHKNYTLKYRLSRTF